MKAIKTDIDIDLFDRSKLLDILPHIDAKIDREDGPVKHNTGVYVQPIPRDPISNLSTIDYKEAEGLGYVKLDLLNNSVYKGVKSEEHLDRLLNTDQVLWDLFEHKEIIEKLFHINQYTDLVARLKPTSIDQLAMILAIIRPGKAYLQNKSWEEIEKDVWNKPTDGSYFFKKSHSYSYAAVIIVQLNLMTEKVLLA